MIKCCVKFNVKFNKYGRISIPKLLVPEEYRYHKYIIDYDEDKIYLKFMRAKSSFKEHRFYIPKKVMKIMNIDYSDTLEVSSFERGFILTKKTGGETVEQQE